MATKDQYLVQHSKLLQGLKDKLDDLELIDGNINDILKNPEEFAEAFAEKVIVKHIPDMIKARIEGEKLARQLIDRKD